MKKMKTLWMPLALGMLLMGALVGVAGARPNARPEASPALQNYMVSAHHCIADNDDRDYSFDHDALRCNTPNCDFACLIKPPHEGLIRVRRLGMYAYDDAAGDLCINLTQVYPRTGAYVFKVHNQCTGNSAADPEVYAFNPANFKVSVLQDLYVWVSFHGSTQRLYGFKLRYEPL
jgi:hypothetical protein